MENLEWRVLCATNSPNFWTKGTELASALVGPRSQYQVIETRTIQRQKDGSLEYDREYVVRDAAGITLAEVRAGKRPPIVGRFATLDEFLSALKNFR